ncbi:hypothetical protein AB0J21_03505 [Streptomyces sp. NPDC049954]|uniref:hypothetical protein n=1 Tax=Streptomyces sp. NPDC049954 TaxID=3155779 RepID=UPI003428699C
MSERVEETGEEACARCAELRREEVLAEAGRDYSRATDCRVLIGRHPHDAERERDGRRGRGASEGRG